MNTFTQLEIGNDQLEMIRVVKAQVDELYFKHQIFNLSLETLELTRRFNDQFKDLEAVTHSESVGISKFLALTQHLERNLIRELK